MDSKNMNNNICGVALKAYVAPEMRSIGADREISLVMASKVAPYYELTIGGTTFNTSEYAENDALYLNHNRRHKNLYDDVETYLMDEEWSYEEIADYFESDDWNNVIAWGNAYAHDYHVLVKSTSANPLSDGFNSSDAWGEASSPFGN